VPTTIQAAKRVYNLHVLDSHESLNYDELLDTVAEWQGLLGINVLIGKKDKRRNKQIREYNKAARELMKPRINYAKAPFSKEDNLSFYIDAIRSYVKDPTAKRLYFHGHIKDRLLDIGEFDTKGLNEEDSPPVAALGYAVALFKYYKQDDIDYE
jgi:hypothetical protein